MSKERMKQMRAPTEEEEALKRKVREEMVQDRCRLLDCQPFVGKLAMHLNMIPVIDCRLTTACTDGTHLYVDAEFYSRLSPAERLGIIAHEVWHCGLRHFQRKGNRDRDKFNYAADVEVDLLLHQDGFKIEMLPFDPEWVGMTAEQIYELMPCGMEHFQKNEKHLYSGDQPEDPCTASGGQGGQSGQDKSDDSSPGNDGEQDKSDNSSLENDGEQDKSDNSSLENDGGQSETSAGSSEEDGEGGGSIGGNGGGNGGGSIGGTGRGNGRGNGAGMRPGLPNVKHDDVIDPDYCPALSSELGDNWRNNLKTAVQQMRAKRGRSGRGCGNLPRNVAGLVQDDELVATVDWKRVLLDYVTQVFGGERQWLPPSRRHVWKKLYLPSRAKKKAIEIVLAVDTSGSTTRDLPDFLAELRGMVNAFGEYKLTIIQCDCSIHSVKEYSNDEPVPENGLVFHGFGGTSFLPPFQYVEEKMELPPTVFIYLTDGYGEAPQKEPDYPVIWCITEGGRKPSKWGLEVQIDPSKHKNRKK